jgi:hypothetical protein
MTADWRSNTGRVAVIILVTLGFFGLLAFLPPLRQNPAYHAFADTRSAFGVPNAANVFSSFALVVVGLFGLIARARTTGPDRYAEVTLMTGLTLVGIGSAYYHLQPHNERLFWDRLPAFAVSRGGAAPPHDFPGHRLLRARAGVRYE